MAESAGTDRARASITARPPFMSVEPTPWTRRPSTRAVALPWGGTVSRCPTSVSTGRPPVGAADTTQWPTRSTGR